MKPGKLFFLALIASVLLASCSNDDESHTPPLGTYDNGILVINEGNGTAGSISFISNDMVTTQQDVYGAENAGDGIGSYVQSIFFDGDRAFIISNGSNKITVVNRYTFALIDKIDTNLDVPRYGAVINGKAYVTNLGHDFTNLTDDFISVINLSTYEVENTIPVHAIADKIIVENGKLYVANGNYGEGNSVSVIDPATGTIIKTINTGIAPNSFEEKNGNLYVLCSNYSDPSKLVKISLSDNEIVSSITLPGALGNAQNLNIEDGKLYFTVNNDIFSANLDAASITDTPLFASGATTLYGFMVENGKIYVSDARDYASDGKVFIYSKTGTLENQFTVGLIPNGFYFND